MSKVVKVFYENGVFKFLEKVNLPESLLDEFCGSDVSKGERDYDTMK